MGEAAPKATARTWWQQDSFEGTEDPSRGPLSGSPSAVFTAGGGWEVVSRD